MRIAKRKESGKLAPARNEGARQRTNKDANAKIDRDGPNLKFHAAL
jgi:hypothetical protein